MPEEVPSRNSRHPSGERRSPTSCKCNLRSGRTRQINTLQLLCVLRSARVHVAANSCPPALTRAGAGSLLDPAE
eukprot:6484043-Amphidinium_carterae.1